MDRSMLRMKGRRMITTLRWSSLRLATMVLCLLFIAIVMIMTAQSPPDMRMKVEVSGEKISALEEWRRAVEATQISPRLATLESQMETSTWLQRAQLGGLGALIIEMLIRLINQSKKE